MPLRMPLIAINFITSESAVRFQCALRSAQRQGLLLGGELLLLLVVVGFALLMCLSAAR